MIGTSLVRRSLAGVFEGHAGQGVAATLERLAGSPPGALAVLTYHRIDEPTERSWLYPFLLSATPAAFERQLAMLADHFQPVALGDVLAAHRGGRALPRRAVLLTFDDAYLDFRDHAWPILRRAGLPATLFVPSAYPDAPAGGFWWDRLWGAVAMTSIRRFDSPVGPLDLGAEPRRRAAARALVEHHKGLPHDEAMASVERLVARLGGAPAGPTVLGWDDLRSLAAAGVAIAPHSRTHPLLTQVHPGRLPEETTGSRLDLERQLDGAAAGTVFAYPAGGVDDRAVRALAEGGFELAFTTRRGVNRIGRSDPLRLRRINVGNRAQPALIRAQIAFYTWRYHRPGTEQPSRNENRGVPPVSSSDGKKPPVRQQRPTARD
ncbi:MAG: hypothetical protein FIA92_17230 [Chloroflexi bacterium]|nr:hypothetical protein [Chloroflexota bacterium]